MIESIMHRLDTMPDTRAVSAMVLIESLRRGTPLSKGGFSLMYTWNVDRTKLELRRDQFESAKRSFKDWWTHGSSWPEKQNRDPLEGTGLRIYDGP
jgi:hypothetical protein